MSEKAPFDPALASALVLDKNQYERGIAIEMLRAVGVRKTFAAAQPGAAWEILINHNPDFALLEWTVDNDPLAFARRVRMSEELPNRALAIFMLTRRGAKADVEAARLAGVDGFLRKPISALALTRRVRAVLAKPQPFVVTAAYVGPCRRRPRKDVYAGPPRRLDDRVSPAHDDAAADVKAELARASVAALEAHVRDLIQGEACAARAVYQAVLDLADVGERIGDRNVAFGAREMARYIQAQGATERLDPEVVRTHVAALHQLAHLPHALGEERERVAQSLKRMVDKKLRDAA